MRLDISALHGSISVKLVTTVHRLIELNKFSRSEVTVQGHRSQIKARSHSSPTDRALLNKFSRSEVTVQGQRSQFKVRGHRSRSEVTVQGQRSQFKVTVQGHRSQFKVRGHSSRSEVTVQGQRSQFKLIVRPDAVLWPRFTFDGVETDLL